jgi:ubiquinone/menaquinone biosynthesis C-methylase UbiE
MDQHKITKIKDAVRGNFDASSDRYLAFEEKRGFFRALNAALLSRMQLPEAADILDVGCGTGASSVQLLEAIPWSRVWGLDCSPGMLEAARSRVGESDRLAFVEGDAARLSEYFAFPFDAVIYSASVFLIPDYRESLREAADLLKEGGQVGLTFMDGLYDWDGNNLFQRADEVAGEGVSLKKPVKMAELQMFFRGAFPVHESWNEDFMLPEDVLKEFFSIPAMSAGLFPGIEYSERVRKVTALFRHMPTGEILFRWMMMRGQKSR